MEGARERWVSEKTHAYLSRAVAAHEREPKRAALFGKMADAAEAQAAILAKDMDPAPSFKPSVRSRVTAMLLGVLPPRAMRHILSAHRVRGMSTYRGPSNIFGLIYWIDTFLICCNSTLASACRRGDTLPRFRC